jgi:phosphoribosylanthranilate isomerase
MSVGERNGPERRRASDTVVRVFVKICGITNEDDALLAVAMRADALGFVFAPGSPRQVTPTDVRAIVQRLAPGTMTIGVFRDERPERVVEIVGSVGLRGAQLHGREPASEVRWVRERIPFVVQGYAAGDRAVAGAPDGGADVVLLDGADAGSGRAFDWELAEGAPRGMRLLLAGGLTPENVADAIRRVRPWGVDVSSGVETSPGSGRKDPRRLRAFIEAAHDAGAELAADGWSPGGDGAIGAYDWQADERPA